VAITLFQEPPPKLVERKHDIPAQKSERPRRQPTLRILSGVLHLQGLDVAQGPSGRSTPDRIQLN
jgi:hypothetical protein